jgi:hypothetical protein
VQGIGELSASGEVSGMLEGVHGGGLPRHSCQRVGAWEGQKNRVAATHREVRSRSRTQFLRAFRPFLWKSCIDRAGTESALCSMGKVPWSQR